MTPIGFRVPLTLNPKPYSYSVLKLHCHHLTANRPTIDISDEACPLRASPTCRLILAEMSATATLVIALQARRVQDSALHRSSELVKALQQMYNLSAHICALLHLLQPWALPADPILVAWRGLRGNYANRHRPLLALWLALLAGAYDGRGRGRGGPV